MTRRYYTSPQQLAASRGTGHPVEWLECDECDGSGFYPDPDEPEVSELCELCRGRGGDWGMRMAEVVLSEY